MTIKRRTFVKAGLAAGAALGFGSLSGCGPLTRLPKDQGLAGQSAPANLSPRELEILYYASLAPSGHNTQPWLIEVEAPGRWLVLADPARRLEAVDPKNREMRLSLGCFIENLCLAAGQMGLAAEVEPLAGNTPAVARIKLLQAPAKPFNLDLIVKRRTVRSGLLAKELTANHLAALSEAAGPGLHYFTRQSDHGICIAQGAVEAFKVQTANDKAQAELARWTRLSNTKAEKHRDGLTTASMEITGLAGFFVRNFMDSQDVLGEKWRKTGNEMIEEQAGQGAGWLIMTGPEKTTAQLLKAGQRFERLALKARELNIGIHPMTQMLEEASGRQAIANNHDKQVSPLFILRIGYLDKFPKPVSLRRPVAWFVKS